MSVEAKLQELGITVPEAPKPVAAYVPFVRSGDLVFTSGQIAVEAGQLKYKGKVGKDLTPEEGYQAARLCAINTLAVLKAAVGSLDRIAQIVKVVVFVNSAEGFTGQPAVANGASELYQQVFGEKGLHARSAVGASELPMGTAVEVEVIARIAE
ncbi:enamine deaminase RidA (YjgF/YER057c/UK114 family) [Symbiobacterium terraclitae]|uniref:Enamine deaminase RidA (YjgF/YER057c/UK114 family) n=1 Tax=Symbiobacterium terraclitae TaxID=557451 RepID=A0ABS4JMI4_9FIRM|nr:RidA family protein [Symbiobacterium terraclitae]MBP2016753.1 enamine deaminase RidA (YjgF/YER057c/UK114 family) [Symbiobacterium terraclitae]